MSAVDLGRLVIEEGNAGRRAWVERVRASGRFDLADPAVLELVRDKAREAAGGYDLARDGAAPPATANSSTRGAPSG